MDGLVVIGHLIITLWWRKHIWDGLFYVFGLLGVVVAVNMSTLLWLPAYILLVVNWFLFLLYKTDQCIVQINYYRMYNVPGDYVRFVKSLLILALALPEVILICMVYKINFIFVVFVLILILYTFFRIDRSRSNFLGKIGLSVICYVVICAVTTILILWFSEQLTPVVLCIFAGLILLEIVRSYYGKYNRI